MSSAISMQASFSDAPKKQGSPDQHRAASTDGYSSSQRPLHRDVEIGGQQQCPQAVVAGKRSHSASLLAGDMPPSNQNVSITPDPRRYTQHDPSAIVFSPRVAGEEPSRRDTRLHSVSPTLVKEILEKSGMALKVPIFLERVTRESRDVWKTKFKRRPSSPGSRRQPKLIRLKSSALGLVTVPVSAKQWLLQALGLKDSEIDELFHQMESMPQFAAEYIREVKDEWQALESREMKKPPEAEYLSKDQALLEKVRGLILRFSRVLEFEELAKQQECQNLKESDNNGSCSRPRSRNKSPHMHAERNLYNLQENGRSRPDHGTLIREIDNVDAVDTTQTVICPSCGQGRSMCDVDSQRAAPATSTGPKEFSSSQLRHVLPSFIPVDDYIVKHCVVQPELHGKVEHKSRFSPLDKRWYTVLFPALQPGRREDVQLLGEWLQHSMYRNCHESSDGQFEDAEAAFILHSIAFLEIVRQVDLQCEERGNLLLHVWRQILRVFNQVMAGVEPYLDSKEDELKHSRNHMDTMNEQINSLINQLDEAKKQLKDKEIQVQKIKRCRLCLCENMTPRSRDDTVKKAKTKFSSHKRTTQPGYPEAKEEEVSEASKGSAAHETSRKSEAHETSRRSEAHETSRRSETHETFKKPAADAILIVQQVVEEESAGISSNNLQAGEFKENPGDALLYSLHETNIADIMPNVPDMRQEDARDFALDLCADASTQTSERESYSDNIMCESAPAWLQSTVGDAPSLTDGKEQKQSLIKIQVPSEKSKTSEEEANFLKLLGPPAPGSIPIPGTIIGAAIDRLQNFETLALETLGLLEKLPKVEGNLASTIQSLTDNYCRLTGYVLKELDKEIKNLDCSLENETDGPQDDDADLDRGKKKGQAKPGKSLQAKFFVPTSFSKMMKINSVPKNVKSFNARQVTKLIASVYSSKIEADTVDDAANNERQSCSEFVYDFMLNLYGLKGIAESAIHGLFKTIKNLISSKQMEKHHKIRLFSKFVGMEVENFREEDLYLYLKLLQKGMGKPCAILPSDQDDGLVFLNFPYIEYILDEPNLIQFMGSEAAAREVVMKFATKNAISEKASPEIKKLVKENEVKKLDWDHLVESILESRPRTQVQEKRQSVQKSVHEKPPLTEEKLQELVNLFIAGDANQDGVLTFTEFREIISTADPSISTQSALRMFRKTLLLMPDGGDSISPQAFAAIAHDHGISAPPTVVFDLLKKTWSQVQSDVNEDKMQEASQKKEFESLKSTLMAMLEEQKRVTEAVEVFRNLVLKFCGGEEEGEDGDQDNIAASEAGDAD